MTRCPVRFHGVAASDHSDGESGNPQGWPKGSKNRPATGVRFSWAMRCWRRRRRGIFWPRSTFPTCPCRGAMTRALGRRAGACAAWRGRARRLSRTCSTVGRHRSPPSIWTPSPIPYWMGGAFLDSTHGTSETGVDVGGQDLFDGGRDDAEVFQCQRLPVNHIVSFH